MFARGDYRFGLCVKKYLNYTIKCRFTASEPEYDKERSFLIAWEEGVEGFGAKHGEI